MRLKETSLEDMNDAQRAAYDAVVAGPRGVMPPPMRAWIKAPELAMRIQHLGAHVIFGTSLPPRLREIGVLVTARHWTAQFEWYAHSRIAREAGISQAIIDAIAVDRQPELTDEADRVVYAFSKAMVETRGVDQDIFDRAIALLGEVKLVELVGVLGYYALVSITLNAFDVDLPGGAEPELKPLPVR